MLIKKHNKIFLSLVIFASLFLINLAPLSAASGSLYITPSTGTYVVGGSFTVSIKVNTGGDPVNAAEGTLIYDKDLLDVVSISKGGSIFSLWAVDPKDTGSSISFGGGIPHPGYTGTAGTLFSITFKTIKTGTAQISFSSGAVLANDGKGTNILSSMGTGGYTISPRVTAPRTDDRDTTPQPIEKREPVVERIKPTIISLSHPDSEKWYKENDLYLNWKLSETIVGVSFQLNDSPSSDPGPVSDGLFSEKEYLDLEDGVYYFHLKYKDAKGWGTIAHYKVNIDSTAPLPFEIEVFRENDYDWPVIKFKTIDELSKLMSYYVVIGSLEKKAVEILPDLGEYKISGLKVGKHKVLVKAIDNAGNEIYAEKEFYINSIEKPVILNYPLEIRSSDKLFMSGTALANSEIELFIKKESALFTTKTLADSSGNWFLVYEDNLQNGRYQVWAQAKNDKGMMSDNSESVSFLVSPPVFTQIGDFVINYFTVLVSLLFMLLLVIILAILIRILLKKKIKKEAVEIETVLKEKIQELKNEIDTDISKINKGRASVTQKKLVSDIGIEMKAKVETLRGRVMKEIRDVEDIVK